MNSKAFHAASVTQYNLNHKEKETNNSILPNSSGLT